jgi:hypothetical protein
VEGIVCVDQAKAKQSHEVKVTRTQMNKSHTTHQSMLANCSVFTVRSTSLLVSLLIPIIVLQGKTEEGVYNEPLLSLVALTFTRSQSSKPSSVLHHLPQRYHPHYHYYPLHFQQKGSAMYSANVLGVAMVVQHAIFHHTQGPIHLVAVHLTHTSVTVQKAMKVAGSEQSVGSPVHIRVDNKYRLADLVVAVWKDTPVHRVATYSGKDPHSYGHETEDYLYA